MKTTATLATLLLLALAPSAAAAGPEKGIFPFEGTIEDWVECPDQGFNIRLEFFGVDRAKQWRDGDGNVTLLKLHSYGSGTLVNQADPSKTLTGSGPTNITVDYLAETFTVSGTALHNNIPGEGRTAHESGTITHPIEAVDRQTGAFEIDFDVVLRSGGKHPEFVDWCSMVD